MLLNEFPDLNWLKRQVNARFEDQKGLHGRRLKQPGWPSVVLNAKSGETFRDNIKGPFSLFGNVAGKSLVQVDNRQVNVDDDHFFITNSGQNYSLGIDEKSHTETFNVHFGEHFADELIQSRKLSIEKLLDDGFQRPALPFAFHNRLIRKTKEINGLINDLRFNRDELKEEELLVQLFLVVMEDELQLQKSLQNIPSIKKSTRDELVKRILFTADYIHEFCDQSLSLDELANVSALSKFHFLRLFKVAMGKTPHQFVTEVRISKSIRLLTNTREEIRHIAHRVGFPDSSSFSRAFFRQAKVYPTQFRQ